MKLISWNVNGLRARISSHVIPFLKQENPDIVLLQEIKAIEHQIPVLFLSDLGYRTYWHSAERPGYSGVAIFTKIPPSHVQYGIGDPEIDCEGRVLTVDIGDGVAVVNAYFPHSQRELLRLKHKLYFLDKMLEYLEDLRNKGYRVVIGGDFNIAHREIDLRNPRANMQNAGFLPEERAWIDRLIAAGFLDTFRAFHEEGGHYTWWSYRPGVRERNIGWRIDYFFADGRLAERVTRGAILPEVYGSDHCPVALELAAGAPAMAGDAAEETLLRA